MASAKPLLIFLCFFLFSSSPSSSLPNLHGNSNPNSAHEELKSKGFPIGLLPTSVSDYSLNHDSGDFSVNLNGLCKITLPPDNYVATYSPRVTGRLAQGRISELEGVRVRAFFNWWSITGIRASGDDVVFEVGMVTAKYPSRNFNETLECEGRRSSS